MLGLAMGDALGAPYEGGIVERLLWRAIGRTREGRVRWTDDTQMALDLAESLLEENEVCTDAIARRFAASYHWSRGYGPGTARVLKRIRWGERWETASTAVYPNGSFGNGAAMRSAVMALTFADDRAALMAATRTSARVTHGHPLGIEGAVMIAAAAQALLHGQSQAGVLEAARSACSEPDFVQRLETVASWLSAQTEPAPAEVARRLGNGMAAAASVPTALYIALRYLQLPFASMTAFIRACGGDVDTIGAMAGALWGIANGASGLPNVEIEGREEIAALADRSFERYEARQASG
jgi:poly(ADP-ribose) glycohydrolase ARH3